MEISNVSGINQYLQIQSTGTQETKLKEENIEAPKTTPNQESTDGAKPAFQVDLTQKARDLLASEESRKEPQRQTAPEIPATTGNQPGPGEIVNLTA